MHLLGELAAVLIVAVIAGAIMFIVQVSRWTLQTMYVILEDDEGNALCTVPLHPEKYSR